MTPKQIQRIQHITNQMQLYYGASKVSSGGMSFTAEEFESGTVMLFATNNSDLRWFDTHFSCYVLITKQGGISRYDGSMNPKLVLPATPRLCRYSNPFKKLKQSAK
jgi:hypothetical protein